MARTALPFAPADFSVRSGDLARRVADVASADAVRALMKADTRASSKRVYQDRLDEIEAEQSAPAHPNPVVEATPAPSTAPSTSTRRAVPNPRIAAATVRIARSPESIDVTAENRAEIEGATVNLTDGRTVPLYEIRG